MPNPRLVQVVSFRTTTAGQEHGISWAAPVVVKARDFDDYMDAQLLLQKLASCLVGVVRDVEGGVEVEESAPMEGKLAPGTWMAAPAGKTVEFSNPSQLEGIADYVKIQHHGIASGLEVRYMIVSSDFSDSNYTQSRMTLPDFVRKIGGYQRVLCRAAGTSAHLPPDFKPLIDVRSDKNTMPVQIERKIIYYERSVFYDDCFLYRQ